VATDACHCLEAVEARAHTLSQAATPRRLRFTDGRVICEAPHPSYEMIPGRKSVSSYDRLQDMQGDFWGTIKTSSVKNSEAIEWAE